MSPALRRIVAPLKRLQIGDAFVRRNPLFYREALRTFERLETAPLGERRDWTQQRLRETLERTSSSPYGKRVSGTHEITSWPLLDPATVREAPEDFQSGWRSWRIPASTGGTTGMPLPLLRSVRSVATEQAALDYLLRREGIEPRTARVAVLRGEDIKDPTDLRPPFWVTTHGGRQLVLSSNHLNARTLQGYVDVLQAFDADYWWVYPSAIEAFAKLILERGFEMRAPLLFSSSEKLNLASWELVQRVFGSRILDYYGQAERVALAYACEPSTYRMLPGYAHVELIEHDAGPDGHSYEIVGTPLWNEAMTLVRYRTGDLIRFDRALTSEERDDVCLGTRTFEAIQGRDGDILIAPDGTLLTGMDHIQRDVDHVVRIQLVQDKPDHVEIRVLADDGFSKKDADRLFVQARRKIPETMNVEVTAVEKLERTARGKVPFVIRRAT